MSHLPSSLTIYFSPARCSAHTPPSPFPPAATPSFSLGSCILIQESGTLHPQQLPLTPPLLPIQSHLGQVSKSRKTVVSPMTSRGHLCTSKTNCSLPLLGLSHLLFLPLSCNALPARIVPLLPRTLLRFLQVVVLCGYLPL